MINAIHAKYYTGEEIGEIIMTQLRLRQSQKELEECFNMPAPDVEISEEDEEWIHDILQRIKYSGNHFKIFIEQDIIEIMEGE